MASHRWGLPTVGLRARQVGLKRFYILRASEEVCP